MADPKKADDLSPAELAAAERTGTDPGRYAALQGVKNINDWEALERASRSDREA